MGKESHWIEKSPKSHLGFLIEVKDQKTLHFQVSRLVRESKREQQEKFADWAHLMLEEEGTNPKEGAHLLWHEFQGVISAFIAG